MDLTEKFFTLELAECPKCGSKSKKQLGPDLISCESCGMSYHLDSDGRAWWGRQPTARLPSLLARAGGRPLRALRLLLVGMVVLVVLSFLLQF